MKRVIGWLVPDRFILVLIATVALASVLPVRGREVAVANLVSSGAVFVIFLLHGIRLPRAEVIDGLRDWRTQGTIALFVFGIMGAVGFALWRLTDGALPAMVALGFLYIGVLPTTVQSATTYCSLARGAVALSVVASALDNLAAVLVTPSLFALLAGTAGGVSLGASLAVRVALILLLPFAIGQVIQRWARPWAMRNAALVKRIDQGAIAIAVYVAFSAAVVQGIWSKLGAGELAILAVAVSAMLAAGFGGAWFVGSLVSQRSDVRTAILFSGAHKSIAVGAPLAALMFPANVAGMVLLPILAYHLAQLMISAWIAPPLARRNAAEALRREAVLSN